MATTIEPAEARVTVGVDTHADVHVAAAIDQHGRLLGTTRPGAPEATANRKVADHPSSWMGDGSLVDACVVTGIPRI